MYTIKCDNEILLNKFVPGRKLIEPHLLLKANIPGTLTFTISDEHPCYNSINLLISRIKIYDNGQLIWIGRPKSVSDSGRRLKSYVCEGCLSFLKDGFVAPYNFSGSPAEFFQFIINSHNANVPEAQQISLGTCTITDPNDYITRSSQSYDTPFDVLKDKMLDKFGGYLYITYDQNEKPILSYYADVPYTCTQLVEFGKNLVSYENNLIYDEMYTACIPLGAKDDAGSRLTIDSVNDGKDYLVNETLSSQYGVRFAPTSLTTWDDVTVAANLKVKGQNWLDDVGIKYKDSVYLSAIDISTIKQGVQSFKFLWKAGFKLRNGQVIYYVVTELDIDLNRSANVEINLGDEKKAYTGLVSDQVSNIASQVSVIQSDYTTRQESQQISETVIETTTQIQTQANAIIAQVLEAYYTKAQVDEKFVEDVVSLKSQVEQLASSITASFVYYNSVVDALTSSVTEIKSWVTIVPETPTQSVGLIIGNSNSAIKLKLENDILYFYVGDDTAPVVLMWLDHETLHIDRVEIQRLSIGSTGKMLDFKIVGSGLNTCAFFQGRLVL